MLAVVMRFDPLGLIHSVTVATAEGRKEGVCREEIKSTALGASKDGVVRVPAPANFTRPDPRKSTGGSSRGTS
jgi:hypothetical protein